MEQFEKFEIENQEMIFGGDHRECTYTTSSGATGEDIYDTETKNIIYFPVEEEAPVEAGGGCGCPH